MSILLEVKHKQAAPNTIYHSLYDFYYQGQNITQLSKLYGKSKSTISSWIAKYEKYGPVARRQASTAIYKKFSQEKRQWLVDLYKKKPILHRNEATHFFFDKFNQQISVSSITSILHDAGLTWQKLERRAIQLQLGDIIRFSNEMINLDWMPQSLVFLDEVSFDNTDMIRKSGYGVKGQRLLYRGEFSRKARISLLCFLGYGGILETYKTENTFTRLIFLQCCRDFALKNQKTVEQYPGKHSVWIMDGARIHCCEELVTYLRSLGIIVVFLPAYAPFYNPIEIVFGWAKNLFKKVYQENTKMDVKICVGEVMNSFTSKPMANLFRKCGYLNGKFDPSSGLEQKLEEFGFEAARD